MSREFSVMYLASGGFAPRSPPGLCPWTPLGDVCPPDLLFRIPFMKILDPPLLWVSLQWHHCDVSYKRYIVPRCHWKHPTSNNVLLICFLWPKRLSTNTIHTEMHPLCGDKVFYKTNNTCLVYEVCWWSEYVLCSCVLTVHGVQDAVAVWDYKTVAVYKIDSEDGRMSIEPAGSFVSNTRYLCLFGLNVYTVEPGRIHVRNFQVNDDRTLHR